MKKRTHVIGHRSEVLGHRKKGHRSWVIGLRFFALLFIFSMTYDLSAMSCFADTIYFKSGSTEKGLIVEEYYDRFVFNTPDGEKEITKASIDEIFFDEPYQNNLYMGKKFEAEGSFEKALQFYQLSLQSNPDFKEAQNAIKGLEDAKWRFKKTWRYKELREILSGQLGVYLKSAREKTVISKVTDSPGDLSKGDVIISCWAQPLTYAGLKNSSRQLIGLSNTLLKVVIERDVKIGAVMGLKLLSPLVISMEFEGPTVKSVGKGSLPYDVGLRPGDLIIKINGDSTRYMTAAKIRRKIFHGSKEKTLTIRREVNLMRKRSENGTVKNAMWAWHSKEAILNEAARKELLDFCKAKNIGVLFFQLQYQFLPYRGQTVCHLLHDTKLRAFLKEAHSQGIMVYALDGAPEFCLDSQHYLILAQITAILDFNKKASPQERFDGVHYDNEPYILAGFHSNLKSDIIRQYLELNQKCKNLIIASGAKLDFGVDIPFWFDQLDRLDAKLIDICDDVGIMDYRNFASGPDGIVALAMDELKYAAETKKKVFVGVETSRYPEQEVWFVSALSEDEFNSRAVNLHQPRFEGFPLRAHSYDKKVYLGLVKQKGADEDKFMRALSKLGELYGRISKPQDKEAFGNLTFDIISAISTNPEFRDVQYKEHDNPPNPPYLMFMAKEEILEKLTFAGMTEKELNDVLAEAYKEFKNYPSFAGFAIHHYKSYKELCEKSD